LEKKLFYALNEKKPFAIHWSTAIINKETGEKINEIVIDLDEDSEETNRKLLIDILKKIKELKINKEQFFIKTSGNKGYHIIVSPFIEEDKKKGLLDYINTLFKSGYKIDLAKINSNSHMIRAPFSINFKSGKFSEVLDVDLKRTKIEIKEIDYREQIKKVLTYYSNFPELNKEQENEENLDEIIIAEDIEKAVSYINRRVAEEVLGKNYEEVDYLLYKISKDLSREISYDLDLGIKGKMLVKVIKEEVTTIDGIVDGVTYYLLLFLNKVLAIKRISVKLKQKKDIKFIQTKTKEEILKVDKVESFGLYTEEGERKLFVKYENGMIQEIKLDSKPELKEILVKWLKDNGLLMDLIFKYGYIWSSPKLVRLNVFDDYAVVRVSEYGKDNIIKEQVGSYNPNKKVSSLFLPASFINMAQDSHYNFEFFEHILDGLLKSNVVKVVVGYAFATLLKDLIKDNSILPVIPNLWIYSSVPNTGKTTILHIIKIVNALKEFESGITIAQVRNLLSIRNNVVVIDDIQNFGDNETKKIITSWLKASSTQSITITLGTGEQFTISSPIATTSNYHPKEVLNSDEALLQRIILININRPVISYKWLKDLHRLLPDFNSKVNNQLALNVYILYKLKELAKKRDLVVELFLIKSKIEKILKELVETDNTMKYKYNNGYKYFDSRFLSFITFIYYGLWLFDYIYKPFLEKLDEKKLIKDLAEFIIENNEVYKNETLIQQLMPLVIESHNLETLSKNNPILVDMQIFKEIFHKIGVPVLFKKGDEYLFVKTKEFRDLLTSEAKIIFGNQFNFNKIMSELRNMGADPSKVIHLKRRIMRFNKEGKAFIDLEEEEANVRILSVPYYLVEPFIKEFSSILIIDLDNNEYKIIEKENEEKGDEK